MAQDTKIYLFTFRNVNKFKVFLHLNRLDGGLVIPVQISDSVRFVG